VAWSGSLVADCETGRPLRGDARLPRRTGTPNTEGKGFTEPLPDFVRGDPSYLSRSKFFHCTVVPAAISMRSGMNACPFMLALTVIAGARVDDVCVGVAVRAGAAARDAARSAGAFADAVSAGVGFASADTGAFAGAVAVTGALAAAAVVGATESLTAGTAGLAGGSIAADASSGLEKKRRM